MGKRPVKSANVERLIRVVGSGAKVARALGMSDEQVSRVRRGHQAERGYFLALAELLEKLPVGQWPERWQR